jgi:hypothetical protein
MRELAALMNLEWLGYSATAVFASSYFLKNPRTLRKVQALAALLWIGYGALIHATPVIVANAVVAAIAVSSLVATRRRAAQ